ncbi:MAG: NAD-dependent epimerase/dehydratase family protein [Polyangiales bacterium]
MQTLLITGIGGFIGLRLAGRARAAGLCVRGLDVSAGAAARAQRIGCSVVVGDVTDPDAAARACEGADAVVHTAAVVLEGGDWEPFRRINVGGTETVARAARAAGVRRFLQLSSVMVYGFDYPRYVTEEGPLRGENNPYCQTKIDSERAAPALHDPGRFDVVVLRPGDVYGPGSLPWVVRPVQLMQQRLFALPDGGRGTMSHLYVDNLADAVMLALRTPHTGLPFNVTDEAETTFGEYFGRLATIAGCPMPPTAPARVLRLAFGAVDRGARLVGRAPPASPAALDFIRRPHPYSIERAKRELGYRPRVSLDEGLAQTERWLRAEGLVPRRLAASHGPASFAASAPRRVLDGARGVLGSIRRRATRGAP